MRMQRRAPALQPRQTKWRYLLLIVVILSVGIVSWKWFASVDLQEHALPAAYGLRAADRFVSLKPDPLLCAHVFTGIDGDLAREIAQQCKRHGTKADARAVQAQMVAKHSLFADNVTSKLKRNEEPRFVLFQSVPGLAGNVSLSAVYGSVDRIAAQAQALRGRYPGSIIVWTGAPAYLSSISHAEGRELALFLLGRYLMSRMRVICLLQQQPAAAAAEQIAEHVSRLHQLLPRGQKGDALLTALLCHRDISCTSLPPLHEACAKYLHSRRFAADCMPYPKLLYPLLVTGLGGAGTHYIAAQLQALGYDLRHEAMGSQGSVSWLYAANDAYFNVSYPYGGLQGWAAASALSPRFRHVLHLTRSPAQQISSLTSHSNKSYAFMSAVLEGWLQAQGDSTGMVSVQAVSRQRQAAEGCYRGQACNLHFAALAYLHWNRLVEGYADAVYQVEQPTALLEHACRLLQLTPSEQLAFAAKMAHDDGCLRGRHKDSVHKGIEGEQRGTHSRPHGQYSMQDIGKIDASLMKRIIIWATKHGY